jgi:hypothetical protein
VKLGERVQAHRLGPYSATRGEASVRVSTPVFRGGPGLSNRRRRCFGGRSEARQAPRRSVSPSAPPVVIARSL